MEIIIGRDQQTRKLNIIKDGNPYLYGQEGFVPMNVSRQHISLQSLEDGKWQIHNLNDRNVTYVNGIGIESKTISETDIIELGESHFPIPWAAILEPEGETIDISPLKQIWDDYDEKRIQHQIAERKFSAARSATGIITMLAIACSIILGHGPIYICLYVIAIGISVLLTYQAYKKSSEVPRQQREMNKEFQQHYVCPKCGHFMGLQDYEVLRQGDACPYCRIRYKK